MPNKKYHSIIILCHIVSIFLIGCAGCSSRGYKQRYFNSELIINVFESGGGPYGCIGVSSIRLDGNEKLRMINNKRYRPYDPTPRPFNPGWFTATEITILKYPRTIDATWFVYGEQQLYNASVVLPSYNQLKKIMNKDDLTTIGLAILFDMPPQIKIFVFDTKLSEPHESYNYCLVGTGIGTLSQDSHEQFNEYTKDYCEKGYLPDKICNKFISGLPKANNER